MIQESVSSLEYLAEKKLTRCDRFLAKINSVTPRRKPHKLVEPFYPKAVGAGRPLIGLARMVRMYVAQQCFSLSDESIEDTFYDGRAMCAFFDIYLSRESAPDAPTLLKFRRLLKVKDPTCQIFDAINRHLAEKRFVMSEGALSTRR